MYTNIEYKLVSMLITNHKNPNIIIVAIIVVIIVAFSYV